MKLSNFFLAGLLLFVLQTADAQRRPHHDPERDPMRSLNLTEAQQQQLTQLRADHKTAMETTRTATFESEEARREAARTLRKRHREETMALLTPEQQTKLKSLHEGRRELRQKERTERRNDPERRAKRQAAREYRDKNITPVLQQQRAKLQVDPADEAELDRLRKSMAQRKEQQKAQRKQRRATTDGERPRRPEPTAEMRTDREAMRKLLDKYKPQIEVLMAEIEPQRKQWRSDLKVIGGDAADRPRRREPKDKMKDRKDKLKGMGAAKFLLME